MEGSDIRTSITIINKSPSKTTSPLKDKAPKDAEKNLKHIEFCNLMSTETMIVPCQWLIIDCNPLNHQVTQSFFSKLIAKDPETSTIDYIRAPWVDISALSRSKGNKESIL